MTLVWLVMEECEIGCETGENVLGKAIGSIIYLRPPNFTAQHSH